MDEQLCSQIRFHLESMGETALAQFSSALIPGLSCRMLGIRLPRLRAYARELARTDGIRVLHEGLSTDLFEEIMLRGLLIGYIPMSWEERWREICKFVPLIDNWSVCDSCCATYKEVRRHREEVWPALSVYLHSNSPYQQRFAVVMMLDHFLVDDFIDRVLAAWEHTVPSGFYVEMAIGWGMSVAFLNYPERCMAVFKGGRLPKACLKKSYQKILESRRTPKDLRSVIKIMKSQ